LTFRFCADGKPSGPVMVLGFYDHDENLDDEDLLGKSGDNMPKLRRHHAQIYTNGSKCDLTGQLRRTEVRVNCKFFHLLDEVF